jgi:hypothetical protein
MNPVRPDYAGGSIVNLASSLLHAFGIQPPNPPCRPELLSAELLATAPGVVLLVCDALGRGQLDQALASGRAPNLERLVRRAPGGVATLTSVFPTTTTSALPSLCTALTPAQHGMLGMRQWLGEIGALGDMLRFRTVAEEPQPIAAELIRSAPTLYEQLRNQGFPALALSASQHQGTGFTDLLHEGAQYLGYEAQSEIPYLLQTSLEQHRGRRSFHYVYWPFVDTLSHAYGPQSEPCALEMEFVDLMLGKVMDACARAGHTLLLTADHGQIALDPARALVMGQDLGDLLRYPPAGGRRACYLAARDPAALKDHPLLHHPELLVLPADELVAQGWFGGDCGPFRSRLGDFVLLPDDGCQLMYDYGQGLSPNRGGHAGMSAEEMLVPLIAAPYHS